MAGRLLVSPRPIVVRRMIALAVGGIRNRLVETQLPYFADFPWLPITGIADVIHAARVRGS